ncbi:hypothetical protein J437_LFUL014457 [Ladona fulva]|uniref:Uncharacterized protein n=1 Tax=Ladona fulva TaxID=123851 RepID=A0A8K0KG63_LADFU|nr:hypothetical protein J437_LFUL014457 [Ladona fulva]
MENLKERNFINGAQLNLCCNLVKRMQTDVCLLQRELNQLTPLEEQYREHLKEFLQLTQLVDSKLQALWAAAAQFESEKILKTREFVNIITTAWKTGDEEIRKKIRNTQLVSQNYPNTSLEQFIQAVSSHFSDLRKNVDAIPRHINCCHVALAKNKEINLLLNHLSHLDNILQHYISLGRANPFLQNINHLIDQFIIHEGYVGSIYGASADKIWNGVIQHMPPGSVTSVKANFDLSAFHSVMKLLTGELLGYEPLDPLTGLEPLVKDSKLEIFLVPSASVQNTTKSMLWRNLSETDQTEKAKDFSVSKVNSGPDKSTPVTKEPVSEKKNVESNKKNLIDITKQAPKENAQTWKNKRKLRGYLGAAVDAELQPIKIPRLEGALIPPLS